MVEFYTVQVKLGAISLEDVPEKFRKAVEERLKNNDRQ
jgi:hypothetical protein